MSAAMQALCCLCGELRTCRRPRNRKWENYWLQYSFDPDWHRETGDLKCDNCGRVTTHAIITGNDHAEKIREAATGWHYKVLNEEDRRRIQQRWRQGLPRNPFARHIWWCSDEEKARAAGKSHFQAICKAEIPVPTLTREQRRANGSAGYGIDEFVKPKEFHDVDREDPDTGLWWFDVDCTDCLYRSNAITAEHLRDVLKEKLLEVAGKLSTLDTATVAALVDQFRAVDGGGA